jgi:hypothetical protein
LFQAGNDAQAAQTGQSHSMATGVEQYWPKNKTVKFCALARAARKNILDNKRFDPHFGQYLQGFRITKKVVIMDIPFMHRVRWFRTLSRATEEFDRGS